MKTLILGDSFADQYTTEWHPVLFDNYEVIAKGGVDNNWISRSCVHELLHNKYDYVFVMFTGLHRTSIAMPTDNVPDYYFSFPITDKPNDLHYIQSGGFNGTWKNLDSDFFNIFKKQYINNNSNFFTNLSMYSVVSTISFLKEINIPYSYTFIYDIFADDTRNDHCLGVCKDKNYWDVLDKTKYIPINPYNFGLENNYISEDKFHLTPEGQIAWANSIKEYIK